jgi:hypothetical protein
VAKLVILGRLFKVTTIYDNVIAKFKFPKFIERWDYQVNTVNSLAPLPRAGYYLGGGTGKTFVATASCLHKFLEGEADIVIGVMPPILTKQWHDWIQMIEPVGDDSKLTSKVYAHKTPATRKSIPIQDFQFVFMSMQIFKQDFEEIMVKLRRKKVILLIDEAHSIKNVESKNNRRMNQFMARTECHLMLLTATPISTPVDGYAFVKSVAPSVYRSLTQFNNIHVGEVDFFGKILSWRNLDLLATNMRVNAVKLERREVQQDLPPVLVDPLYYDLDPKHMELYRELCAKRILMLEDGGKIDAMTETRMYHATQQIICNYDHFSGNPDKEALILEQVELAMDATATGKLVVVGGYKMTNAKLVSHFSKYNAVGIYGDIPESKKQENKNRFISDPECRMIVIHPAAAGFGVDGLQSVCSDMFFVEIPVIPKDYHQTVWRLDRSGQKNPVNVKIAVARGTVQERLLRNCLHKDEIVNHVMPSVQNMRDALRGL